MPRYIDANEFRKRIDHYPPDIRDTAKKELRYTPTANVVEVVRCKDCRWHEMEEPGMVYCQNIVGGWCNENWFCADGERRTNGEIY